MTSNVRHGLVREDLALVVIAASVEGIAYGVWLGGLFGSAPSLGVGAWTVDCIYVSESTCAQVAQVFANSLVGRGGPVVGSGDEVDVTELPACPSGLPSSYVDTSSCWQALAASLPVIFKPACVIVARSVSSGDLVPVGGDNFSGAFGPPKWWQRCG